MPPTGWDHTDSFCTFRGLILALPGTPAPASQEGLSLAASVLSVNAEDVRFENVRYLQGAEVPIAVNPDFVLQQDAHDTQGKPGLDFSVVRGLAEVLAKEQMLSRQYEEATESGGKHRYGEAPPLRHRIAQARCLSGGIFIY